MRTIHENTSQHIHSIFALEPVVDGHNEALITAGDNAARKSKTRRQFELKQLQRIVRNKKINSELGLSK